MECAVGVKPRRGDESGSAEAEFLDESVPGRWIQARVLLVSCDDAWARPVDEVLTTSGFEVTTALSVDEVLSRAVIARPDLVAVDLSSTPHDSGVAVCAALRARTSVGVVAIGRRAAEELVLAALDAGADIFVPRDASPRELVARVRAVLRRLPPERPASPAWTNGPVGLDPARHSVFVAGQEVDLAEPEFRILEALLRTPGRAVSRRELTEAYGGSSATSALDRHIRRLRRKLEAQDPVRRITAVRGIGFRFEEIPTTTDKGAVSQ